MKIFQVLKLKVKMLGLRLGLALVLGLRLGLALLLGLRLGKGLALLLGLRLWLNNVREVGFMSYDS